MPEEIVMPRLSDTMQEGTIARWIKHEGDPVKTGEALMEVETDKATLELNSYYDGTLAKIIIDEGGTAPVGTVVGILATPGETIAPDAARPSSADGAAVAATAPSAAAGASPAPQAPQAPQAPPKPQTALAPRPQEGRPQEGRPQEGRPQEGRPQEGSARAQPGEAVPGSVAAPDVKASPLARVMAEGVGLDLRLLAGHGSGPGGRIVRQDVEAMAQRGDGQAAAPAIPVTSQTSSEAAVVAPAAVSAEASNGAQTRPTVPAAAPAAAPVEADQAYEDRELSRMRQGIARNIGLSKPGVPHIYLTIDVEMAAALTLRDQLNEAVGDNKRARLSVNDLVVKAAALALRTFPDLNAWYIGEKPAKIRYFRQVNLGVAVSLEGGLVVPVIKNADLKTLGHLATESKDMYDRVRSGKARSDEYTGGTFTVSNLGQYGIDEFQAVINPPQAGILAVGAASPKPVVRDGELTIRTIMRVTLSSDHRVIDGVYGAQYLQEFKRLLETPLHLVL